MPAPKKLLFLIPVILIAVAISLYLQSMPVKEPGMKPVVVIIGDSNSDPNSITQVKKWSEDYATEHQDDQTVINFSLGGHAVKDFDTDEEFQIFQNVADEIPPQTQVVVVSLLGTNNAIMREKNDTPEQFTADYSAFLTEVRSILKPNAIFLAAIPPAFPNPANPLTTYTPNFQAYQSIAEFNVTLASWAAAQPQIGSTKLYFLELLPSEAYDPANINTYLINDGIHLNRSSQLIVLKKVNDAVQGYLQGRATSVR